jgi:GNAT superfamily N-acetyltransferase
MLEIKRAEKPATMLKPFLPPQLDLLVKYLPKTAVALTAEADGVRTGIALAVLDKSGKLGTVHALHVAEPFRQQGIGSRLLVETENRLREAGCERIQVELYEDLRASHTEPLAFAQNREYAMERSILRQFVLSTNAMVVQPWVIDNCRLPEGGELFPWRELTESERIELRARTDIPPSMSPWLYEDRIDMEWSVGMRLEGRIAGWLLMERTQPDTMLYRTMYMLPEYERLGAGFLMATEATRVPGFTTQYPFITFKIVESNRSMVRLIERRYAEATVASQRLVRLSKAL